MGIKLIHMHIKCIIALYPWFYMPSSVHKILIHGADMMNHVSLSIGIVSEEAQESRNKDLWNLREQHIRKNSRKNTMEDWMHSLHFSSDPLISSISKLPSLYSRNQVIVDNDVQNLLLKQNIKKMLFVLIILILIRNMYFCLKTMYQIVQIFLYLNY